MNDKEINNLKIDVRLGVFDLIEMKLDALAHQASKEKRELLSEIRNYLDEKRNIALAIRKQL